MAENKCVEALENKWVVRVVVRRGAGVHEVW
jgi:hypothetical protein